VLIFSSSKSFDLAVRVPLPLHPSVRCISAPAEQPEFILKKLKSKMKYMRLHRRGKMVLRNV
jgi:hypothetical protein